MLSVIDTLKKTVFLWIQNFWYLVALSVVIGFPATIIAHLSTVPSHPRPSWPMLCYAMSGQFLALLFHAGKVAGVVGLLTRDPSQESPLHSIYVTIKSHVWTLVRLIFLIGLTYFSVLLPVTIIIHHLDASRYAVVIALGFYVVLVKYALAYPLVVVEKLNARSALQRSWQMTKGQFGYIL